ncbi:MAG: hypothetical protein IJW62_01995 [Clostridia bacterium]|nr:hypothetical protein [Clostridia bacterium]
MKHFKNLIVFWLIICLSFSVCACNHQQSLPPYVGEWIGYEQILGRNNDCVTITANEWISNYESVRLSAKYTVSSDGYYTYLELTVDGQTIVCVVINSDMIAICQASYNEADLYNTDYIGVTPNGLKFDADIRENVLFRKSAGTTDVSLSFRSRYNIPDNYTIYYYENADVIIPIDETGHTDGMYAVTASFDMEYAEAITLNNLSRYGSTAIHTNGNFVITDNR